MTEQRPYQDRYEAGKILARRIPDRVRELDPIVLALPRGGVPVGLEVARVLHAPLDVFVVRKLGAPQRPELAIGAISSGGYKVLNHPLIRQLHVAGIEIDQIAERELSELHRREVL